MLTVARSTQITLDGLKNNTVSSSKRPLQRAKHSRDMYQSKVRDNLGMGFVYNPLYFGDKDQNLCEKESIISILVPTSWLFS